MGSGHATTALGLALGLVGACGAVASAPEDAQRAPVELGRVAWGRELEPALAVAGQTQRPVLLLFQEVPG